MTKTMLEWVVLPYSH